MPAGRGAAADVPTVCVSYAEGPITFDTVAAKKSFYNNAGYLWQHYPAELGGLQFVRHAHLKEDDVLIDAPRGVTIYLVIGTGPKADSIKKTIEDLGWNELGDVRLIDGKQVGAAMAYKLTTDKPLHVTVSGGGPRGITVVAKTLGNYVAQPVAAPVPSAPAPVLGSVAPATSPPAGPAAVETTTPKPPRSFEFPTDAALTPNSAARVAMPQASINALEIFETGSGLALGRTSEMILTVTPGHNPKKLEFRFVGKVGHQMDDVRDELLRFVHVSYPKWYVEDAEVTFEDKEVQHDGTSCGAALGTVLCSVLNGFSIDTQVAMTGDISANGKVRAIGGLSAKLSGAVDGHCSIAIIPTDNYDQLVDAVIYSGSKKATDIQVLGAATLTDAIAFARTDREDKLTQAITAFAEIQKAVKKSPDYLLKKEAAAALNNVLALAPQHLSAKVLLEVTLSKGPHHLSATATQYYASLAAWPALDSLEQHEEKPRIVSSVVVRSGLADLRKLLPIANDSARPLVEAWLRFLQAWNDHQEGNGSLRAIEAQRQSLLDEMKREESDPKLMQKMLKEGI
jgi:hypothetical protein